METAITIFLSGFALFLAAFILAFFEVQIEGVISWAGGLPCFRWVVGWFPKEITGYHLGLVPLMLICMLLPIIFCDGVRFEGGLGDLLKIAAVFVFMFMVAEDYLWNIINPMEDYGFWRVFWKRQYPASGHIFIFNLPIEYYVFSCLSLLLTVLSGTPAIEWLMIMISAAFFVAIITVVKPFFAGPMEEWAKLIQAYNEAHNFRRESISSRGRFNDLADRPIPDLIIFLTNRIHKLVGYDFTIAEG